MRVLVLLLVAATTLGAAPARPKPGLRYIYTYYDRNGGIVVNNLPPSYVANRGYILKHVGVGTVTWALNARERAQVMKSPELIAMVDEIAEREGVDPHLARAVIQAESAFNSTARSRAGALGLMQLMPATAQRFGVLDPFDPRQNITGGVKYLKWLGDYFKSNWEKVVAAYNAGEKNVDRHNGIPPFAETRAYVPRVLSLWRNRSVQPDPKAAGAMALLKKGKGGFLIQETPTRNAVDPAYLPVSAVASSSKVPARIFAWRDRDGTLNLTDYPPPAGIKEIQLHQD